MSPAPLRRFDDRTVVVTSGGSGLGRAAAIAFALEGARVLVADPVQDRADETAHMIREASGIGQAVRADPRLADGAEAAMAQAVQVFGGIDALFVGPPIDAGSGLDAILRTHLKGAFHAARQALPHLVRSGGAMVLTAGVSAPGADVIAHSAAAGGVATFTRNVAHQYGPQGVRANAIALGGADIGLPPGVSAAGPNLRGDGADAARLVLFLASGEASYVTGAVLGVNDRRGGGDA